MNILQICNKSPYPPKEGGPIAMYNLTEGLIQSGHNVDVLAISTKKFFVDTCELPENYRKRTSFSVVHINTSIRVTHAFLNLFSSKSYHVQRFDSKEMHRKLIEMLQVKKFDVIQLETIFVGPYINTLRKYSDARIVLRAHNIEHLIWKRIAVSEKNPLKKLYLSYLAKKLENYENIVLKTVDGVACISEIDTTFLKKSGITIPIETVPFGLIVAENDCKNKPSNPLTFFHLGSMDWMPNQEGIKWFLNYCMPLLAKQFPKNKIYLAGRNMPPWIKHYKFPNLEIIGNVSNAVEFINSHDIMIVPLFSGSGVRIKILEGMSLGKVIISTTIGAEGINFAESENILIADTPEQFVEKFRYCINNPEKCKKIGANAYALIKERHNIINTTEILTAFYERLF